MILTPFDHLPSEKINQFAMKIILRKTVKDKYYFFKANKNSFISKYGELLISNRGRPYLCNVY